MAEALSMYVTLVKMNCCSCGTPFALENGLNQWYLDHRDELFYCPKGHSQHYLGKTEAQRERDRRLQAEVRAAQAEDRAEVAERRRRAEKGQKTRILNRVHNGVCPHCKRMFPNLAEHMKTKHTDEKVAQNA